LRIGFARVGVAMAVLGIILCRNKGIRLEGIHQFVTGHSITELTFNQYGIVHSNVVRLVFFKILLFDVGRGCVITVWFIMHPLNQRLRQEVAGWLKQKAIK